MTDQFCSQSPTLSSPLEDAQAVGPDAEAVFEMTRAFWVGTAGALVVRMKCGRTATFRNVQGLLPVRADQLLPGTDAVDILACR